MPPAPLLPPRLLAISDRAALGAVSWESWCSSLAESGIDGLQVREKALSDREVWRLVTSARRAFPPPGRLLVSSRPDLAAAGDADGIQLPVDGLPLAAARALIGPRRLIGRSTHSLAEVRAAQVEGADFVLFGPIFPTPSKAGWLAPRGVSSLVEATKLGVPVIALGGIGRGEAAAIRDAGAWGLAGIRLFQPAALAGGELLELRHLWID